MRKDEFDQGFQVAFSEYGVVIVLPDGLGALCVGMSAKKAGAQAIEHGPDGSFTARGHDWLVKYQPASTPVLHAPRPRRAPLN